MIKKIHNIKSDSSQQGVTLLLAIMILSAVVAISFSLASILFVEVRSSGELLRTEASYYGAQAIGEQALYKVKRKVNANPNNGEQCDNALSNCYSRTVGGIDTNSIAPSENSIADPIQQDTIPPQSGLITSGTEFSPLAKHYVFYDPDHPTSGSGYTKLTLTYLSPEASYLQVYLCEYDPQVTVSTAGQGHYATIPCSDPKSSDGYWRGGFGGVAGGFSFYPSVAAPGCNGDGTCSWTLDSGKKQEIIIFNPSGSTPVYIQLQTFGSDNQPKGIPYFQQTAVDVNGQNSTVGRKLRIKIPN